MGFQTKRGEAKKWSTPTLAILQQNPTTITPVSFCIYSPIKGRAPQKNKQTQRIDIGERKMRKTKL